MHISIFRPRLIIGPGRLGILEKLFKLIDANLPVPMIGSGAIPISSSRCSTAPSAARARLEGRRAERGLQSRLDQPAVGARAARPPDPGGRQPIDPAADAGAALVKRTLDLLDCVNLPIMDPEQYLIADEDCLLDCSKAKRELGWVPQYRDEDMLIAAYKEYRAKKQAGRALAASKPQPVGTARIEGNEHDHAQHEPSRRPHLDPGRSPPHGEPTAEARPAHRRGSEGAAGRSR